MEEEEERKKRGGDEATENLVGKSAEREMVAPLTPRSLTANYCCCSGSHEYQDALRRFFMQSDCISTAAGVVLGPNAQAVSGLHRTIQ